MNKLINGGLAQYFGITCSLSSFATFIGFLVWLYQVSSGQIQFVFWEFVAIIMLTCTMAFIGYSCYKIGTEEFRRTRGY